MLIFQLAALTFTAAVLCLTLKKDQPAFAFLVSVCAAAGVLAATRAGMRCIGFRSPHSGAQDLSLADTVVSRLSDVNV